MPLRIPYLSRISPMLFGFHLRTPNFTIPDVEEIDEEDTAQKNIWRRMKHISFFNDPPS